MRAWSYSRQWGGWMCGCALSLPSMVTPFQVPPLDLLLPQEVQWQSSSLVPAGFIMKATAGGCATLSTSFPRVEEDT